MNPQEEILKMRTRRQLFKDSVTGLGTIALASLLNEGLFATGPEANSADPLHPVLGLIDEASNRPRGQIDASSRDASGAYERHIIETLMPHGEALDVTSFLSPA